MAVSLDGTALAAHIQPISNNNSEVSTFANMRTSDGGIISDAFLIYHGSAGTAEHTVMPQGMVYKDAYTLFVTFF